MPTFREIETIKNELPDNKKELQQAKVDLEKTVGEEEKVSNEVRISWAQPDDFYNRQRSTWDFFKHGS